MGEGQVGGVDIYAVVVRAACLTGDFERAVDVEVVGHDADSRCFHRAR